MKFLRVKQLKFVFLFILLMGYLNRGLFVFSSETETNIMPVACTSHEVNSLLEFFVGLLGTKNDVDEDGNSPEAYFLSVVTQPIICQSISYIIELSDLFSFSSKTFFAYKEPLDLKPVYGSIDHPPEA